VPAKFSELARRAFWRTIDDAEVDGLMAYGRGRKEGDFEFESSRPLRILTSKIHLPHGRRACRQQDGAAYRVTTLLSPARLSFSLSSIPDDELLISLQRGG
jgi:hypothetical protein